MVRLDAALTPEVGVPLINRLEAETDRIRRKARSEGSDELREAHAADAFVKRFAETKSTKTAWAAFAQALFAAAEFRYVD